MLSLFALALLGRAADMFSTWVVTPDLAQEGNPIAKALGWKGGMALSVMVAMAVAQSLTATMIVLVMGLVAAGHNFRVARIRVGELLCLAGIGVALFWSGTALGVGCGLVWGAALRWAFTGK